MKCHKHCKEFLVSFTQEDGLLFASLSVQFSAVGVTAIGASYDTSADHVTFSEEVVMWFVLHFPLSYFFPCFLCFFVIYFLSLFRFFPYFLRSSFFLFIFHLRTFSSSVPSIRLFLSCLLPFFLNRVPPFHSFSALLLTLYFLFPYSYVCHFLFFVLPFSFLLFSSLFLSALLSSFLSYSLYSPFIFVNFVLLYPFISVDHCFP